MRFISATKEGMFANSRVIALVVIVRVTLSGASTPSIVVEVVTVVAPQYTIYVELESVSLVEVYDYLSFVIDRIHLQRQSISGFGIFISI